MTFVLVSVVLEVATNKNEITRSQVSGHKRKRENTRKCPTARSTVTFGNRLCGLLCACGAAAN